MKDLRAGSDYFDAPDAPYKNQLERLPSEGLIFLETHG
jgi:hypothetical protein